MNGRKFLRVGEKFQPDSQPLGLLGSLAVSWVGVRKQDKVTPYRTQYIFLLGRQHTSLVGATRLKVWEPWVKAIQHVGARRTKKHTSKARSSSTRASRVPFMYRVVETVNALN